VSQQCPATGVSTHQYGFRIPPHFGFLHLTGSYSTAGGMPSIWRSGVYLKAKEQMRGGVAKKDMRAPPTSSHSPTLHPNNTHIAPTGTTHRFASTRFVGHSFQEKRSPSRSPRALKSHPSVAILTPLCCFLLFKQPQPQGACTHRCSKFTKQL
jgi:hypothetical protein